MPPAIQIRSLRKVFSGAGGELTVLDGLDLDIEQGQITSIVGPSGSGKTTLLRIISGLEPLTAGTVTIAPAIQRTSRLALGYMFQEDRLLPWRTVYQNATLGVEVVERGTNPEHSDARELLEYVGLGEFIDYYPEQLSHGMRQRVAFVRTLLVDPPLLLLDEPFASVDYEVRLRLENYLLRRAAERGTTIVFVSHDLEQAIVLGHNVVVFSARPAHVKQTYSVSSPPGTRDALAMRQSDEFRSLLGMLAGEVLKTQ
jgi:NitT/TauT family transport system ATP-binding protein